jgi:hypothetical protein
MAREWGAGCSNFANWKNNPKHERMMVTNEKWRSPRLPFSWLNPNQAAVAGAAGGKRGGLSRSKWKRAAARVNGKLGGRPRKPEVKPPLLAAIEQAAAKPRVLCSIDPLAGRPSLDAWRNKYVRVVAGSKPRGEQEEEYWQSTHEDVPCPPLVSYHKVRYRKIAGYAQLLGEAVLTGVVPTIKQIDLYLSPHLDVSRVGARKSTRERERLRIVRAVYWDILWTVQGKKVKPKQKRTPRPPHNDPAAFARYVLEHGLPDEPEPTDTDF